MVVGVEWSGEVGSGAFEDTVKATSHRITPLQFSRNGICMRKPLLLLGLQAE